MMAICRLACADDGREQNGWAPALRNGDVAHRAGVSRPNGSPACAGLAAAKATAAVVATNCWKPYRRGASCFRREIVM